MDGCTPYDGLVFNSAGVLYGTTYEGANGQVRYPGTIFQLAPPASPGGAWTESVIHWFNHTNGAYPVAGLVTNTAGTLVGTTPVGGIQGCPTVDGGCGVVFKLRPPAVPEDPWINDLLYEFTGGPDGFAPTPGGVSFGFGPHGEDRIYGVTNGLTTSNEGVVFQISQ
jgi:hypothetical protein